MRKISLLGIILIGVLLSGCSQQKSGLSTSELFDKKKECANMKNDIQKVIDKSLIWQNDEYFSYKVQLRDIFYSPIKNSCLYSVYYIQTRKGGDGYSCGTYVIQDFLSNNDIVASYLEVEESKDRNHIICLWDKTNEAYNNGLKKLQ